MPSLFFLFFLTHFINPLEGEFKGSLKERFMKIVEGIGWLFLGMFLAANAARSPLTCSETEYLLLFEEDGTVTVQPGANPEEFNGLNSKELS